MLISYLKITTIGLIMLSLTGFGYLTAETNPDQLDPTGLTLDEEQEATSVQSESNSSLLKLIPAALTDTVTTASHSLDKIGTQWAPYLEWSLTNASYSGNPFDLIATATFTHTTSDETRTTEMFYDGNDTWKFRFTGTRTGQWAVSTSSSDPELNGHSGTITINPNANPELGGFLETSGTKFARPVGPNGTLNGVVLNVYMNLIDYGNSSRCGCTDISPTFSDAATFNNYLNEAEAHGANAVFALIGNQWFKAHAVASDQHSSEDPDPVTFEALEQAIATAHAREMHVHIWAWGDQTPRRWTPEDVGGGINGIPDKRIQRYIAARLGPLPGWTMGYGFDLFEWTSKAEVNEWFNYMKDHMGWDHLLWARTESSFDAELPIVHGHDSRVDSGFYADAESYLNDGSNRAVIYERRFTYNRDSVWDMNTTRQAFWQFTMAGGAGSIWGLYPTDCTAYNGRPYPNPEQLATHRQFWDDRFLIDLASANTLTDGWALKTPTNDNFVFYKEGTNTIQIDLSGISGSQPAVAVDTKKAYAEIDLGDLPAINQTWSAPYSSDWAIAIGDFAGSPSDPSDSTSPSTPKNLVAQAQSANSINLSWDASIDPESGISHYKIYRDGAFIGQVFSPTTTFADTGLIASTAYTYEVSAVNGAELESEKSDPVMETTLSSSDTTSPTTPQNLQAAAAGVSKITLTWNAASDPQSGINHYKIYRDNIYIGQSTGTAYVDEGLSKDTTYNYKVLAVNGAGLESDPAGPVSATTFAEQFFLPIILQNWIVGVGGATFFLGFVTIIIWLRHRA